MNIKPDPDLERILNAQRSEEAMIHEEALINRYWNAYEGVGLDERSKHEDDHRFAQRVYRHAAQAMLRLIKR